MWTLYMWWLFRTDIYMYVYIYIYIYIYIDGLVQERRNSIVNALELRLSSIKPSYIPHIKHRGWTTFHYMFNPKCSTTFPWCTINAPAAFAWCTINAPAVFAWCTIHAPAVFAWCTNHFEHKMEFSYIGWNGVHPLCIRLPSLGGQHVHLVLIVICLRNSSNVYFSNVYFRFNGWFQMIWHRTKWVRKFDNLLFNHDYLHQLWKYFYNVTIKMS